MNWLDGKKVHAQAIHNAEFTLCGEAYDCCSPAMVETPERVNCPSCAHVIREVKAMPTPILDREALRGVRGWGVMRPGDRRFHYYRGGRSLCGRVGFYAGPLEEDKGSATKEDCKGCRKRL